MHMIATTYPCPACGALLQLDPHAEADTVVHVQHPAAMPYLETRRRHAVVAFCSGCEFAIEVVVPRG
jgi:hypothetical protein